MTRRRMAIVQPRTSARAPARRLTPSRHASGRHSNRGFTQALLEQHSEAAAARGLAPANAQFGCLLNFLFAPTPETLRPYAALAASLADPAQRVVRPPLPTAAAAITFAASALPLPTTSCSTSTATATATATAATPGGRARAHRRQVLRDRWGAGRG